MSALGAVLLAAASLVWVPAAAGQASQQVAPAPAQPSWAADLNRVFDLLNQGEYLKALDLAESACHARPKDPKNGVPGVCEQIVSFVPGYWQSDSPKHEKQAELPREWLGQLAHAELHDAIPEIVERAKHTNVVILNEEHLAPRDRAFALEVARALRPLGYSILAAEAFTNKPERMAALAADGYPRLKTGFFYTKEPVFGDFVRQSLALGYRPVAYEQVLDPKAPPPADRMAAREQAEADNLVREIFAKDRSAKVLIYVGYSHAAEEPASGGEWMAARLKRTTGIDPLTIDQTTLSPTGERALYAALKPRLSKRSVVAFSNGKPLNFGILGKAVDLEVAHPPERLVHGRPDWLAAMGRKPVAIPSSLRPRSGRQLVQAFIASEDEDAVPVDQLLRARELENTGAHAAGGESALPSPERSLRDRLPSVTN